jgi:hypothetical protein
VPTVLRFDGLRVVIYLNDHAPAHVHIIGPNGRAIFLLNCPAGPVVPRSVHGFTGRHLRNIIAVLNRSVNALCKEWNAIHGGN